MVCFILHLGQESAHPSVSDTLSVYYTYHYKPAPLLSNNYLIFSKVERQYFKKHVPSLLCKEMNT